MIPSSWGRLTPELFPEPSQGWAWSVALPIDGLIALTALASDATLDSLDRRAAATYRRCGVKFEIVGG